MADVDMNPGGLLAGWTEADKYGLNLCCTTSGMADFVTHRVKLLYWGSAAATVFVATLIFSLVNLVQWWMKEPIIKYEIPAPLPPVERKILENPSIKVCVFSFATIVWFGTRCLLRLGSWFNSHSMLCSGDWRIPWICKPLDA